MFKEKKIGFIDFKKLLVLVEPKEKKQLLILFFLMILVGILETLSIGILIPLINFILNPDKNNFIFDYLNTSFLSNYLSYSYINIILILVFIIYFLKYLFLVFYNYYNSKVILKLNASIKNRVFKSYINKNYLFHLYNNSSLLIRNTVNEVDVLLANYISPILTFLLSFLTAFFIFCLLLYYSFVASLSIILIFGTIGLLLNLSVRNRLKFIGNKRQFHTFNILKNLRQSFSSIKEIKMSKVQNLFINQLDHDTSKMAYYGVQRNVIGGLPKIIFEFLFVSLVLIAIFYINLIGISLSEIISLLAVYAVASFRIMPSLNNLSNSYQKTKFGSPALSTVFDVFDNKKEYQIYNDVKNNEIIKFSKEIELKNICFSYPHEKKLILNNLNLKIKKNSTVGIIGENASGKSTFINVLCGLLSPSSGKIIIDGKELGNLNSWQSLIGYVPQQINLLDDDVKSNIALGIEKKLIDKDKVKNLMELTGLKKTLNENDYVGEVGKNISGGQKQKISIARALYNNPEILILDEATSAMDLDAEQSFVDLVLNQDNFP